jgi:predicted signal transduction protein with EAL and GGDEF domain
MVEDADRALYHAKNTGKDRVEVFQPQKTHRAVQAAAHR